MDISTHVCHEHVHTQIEKKMKYAKWKAVEIDRCLKAGITPTPGPPTTADEEEDEFGDAGGMAMPQPNFGGGGVADPGPSTGGIYPPPSSDSYHPVPMPRHNIPPSNTSLPSYPPPGGPSGPSTSDFYPTINASPSVDGGHMGTGISSGGGGTSGAHSFIPASTGGGGAVKMGPEQVAQAQKYCKFASSALDYDDCEGAIDFMSKALHLLKTGKDK